MQNASDAWHFIQVSNAVSDHLLEVFYERCILLSQDLEFHGCPACRATFRNPAVDNPQFIAHMSPAQEA